MLVYFSKTIFFNFIELCLLKKLFYKIGLFITIIKFTQKIIIYLFKFKKLDIILCHIEIFNRNTAKSKEICFKKRRQK